MREHSSSVELAVHRSAACPITFFPVLRGVALFTVIVGIALTYSTAAADDWIELKTPHFTVASEVSESRTREWAIEFELFRRGLGQLMPVEERFLDPVNLVLFRGDRSLKQFVPRKDGQPAKLSAYFVRGLGRTTVAISIEGARDDVRDLVYPGGVHWHLSAAARPLPAWLEIGLGEVFATFHLNGNSFDVGADRPAQYRYVRVSGALPFAQLVKLEFDDISYGGAGRDHAHLIHAQSWLMAHALLFGKDGIGWQALADYMSHAPVKANPADDLVEGLGLDAAALDKRLVTYMKNGSSKPINTTFDRSAVETGFVLRPMGAWEVDLVLGQLLVMADRPDDAEAYLARAMVAAPDDPHVREALAAQSLAQHNYDDAARYYRDAVAHGGENYFNYFALGQIAVREARSTAGLVGTDFGDATVNLVKCLELNAHFQRAYELLGQIAPSFDASTPRAEELLLQGSMQFAGSFDIQLGCAFVTARKGEAVKTKTYMAAAKALVRGPGRNPENSTTRPLSKSTSVSRTRSLRHLKRT
jgi:tetratricopeptide (TPR) repeat protein